MRRTHIEVKRDGPTEASSQAHPPSPASTYQSVPNRAIDSCEAMLLRRRVAAALLLVLVAAAAAAEHELPVEPMELYFSPAELARIAGYGEEPVSSVSVSGQVTCELCLRPGSDLLAFELPGAKVAVLCETGGSNHHVANSAFATTDEFGNFTIDLPSQLHATANLERACTVKVLQLPADSSCRLSHHPSTIYGLRLSSEEDGIRAYTTGVIRLQNSDTPHDKCECRGKN